MRSIAFFMVVTNAFQHSSIHPTQTNHATTSLNNMAPTTFYRRQLPDSVISFSSSEGRSIFASALACGGTHTFFALIEQL
jgi:hypothetical protein